VGDFQVATGGGFSGGHPGRARSLIQIIEYGVKFTDAWLNFFSLWVYQYFLKAINPPKYSTSNISNTSRWVDFQS